MTATAIVLARGSHPAPAADCGNPQRCLFEWYNWLARQQHTDQCPPGVSPVLHVFGQRLNDALPDDRRQDLARFLPNGTSPLAGTAGDGRDETRSYIALDWLIRTYLPAWLDLAGIDASSVRGLPRIADLASARVAGPVVRAAREKSAAAWAAARDAAWDTAGDAAARDAAGDAAWDAAWAAAGDAAVAAAWAAARVAARDTAVAAARVAARDTAVAAARVAAGDAAVAAARAAAGDAAWDAAREILAPTVTSLQESAIALYDQMITGEWPA